MNHRVIHILSMVAILVIGVCCAQARCCFAEPLPLDDYLRQVMQSHAGYLGDQANSAGKMEVSQEADLMFAPQLISHIEYDYQWRQALAPEIDGNHAVTKIVTLGVEKLMDFGFQAQLSLAAAQTILYGIDPALVPNNGQVLIGPYFQFSQSLWQNGFGRMDRKKSEIVLAQDKADSLSNSYLSKVTLAEAESRYWKLATMRETVRVQQESEARTNDLRNFNADRVRRHLSDVSDLLTSDAALESKKLDLQSALDDERASSRAFNSARGLDSDVVEETLSLPDPDILEGLAIPRRADMRDDTLAAEQAEEAISGSSEIAAERLIPTLNIFGSDTSVGINLAVPLDMGTTASVKQGYRKQMKAAELIYQRKFFDQENDWKDLNRKFGEAKERLKIAVRMQQAQQIKYEHERKRQRLGLTTAYQIFQYELDYLNSELARIQLQGLILGLSAQMKTFRGDS
jgi:hypothetical protein